MLLGEAKQEFKEIKGGLLIHPIYHYKGEKIEGRNRKVQADTNAWCASSDNRWETARTDSLYPTGKEAYDVAKADEIEFTKTTTIENTSNGEIFVK